MDIASPPLPAAALRGPAGRRVPGGALAGDPPAAATDAARSFREALSARKLPGAASAPAAAAPPRTGRTLADYRAHAVQRVAPVDPGGGRTAPPSAAPAPSVATMPPVAESAGEPAAGAKAPDGHPAEGFAAAMLKGLDRYRAMQQPEAPQPRVDLVQ